jgi:formylmethanofuran dehydrogenase subunit E
MKIEFTPIGIVKNEITQPREGFTKKHLTSEIEVYPSFAEGLLRLEEHTAIDILFHFSQSKGYQLVTPIYTGEIKGVFASRSPHRPNGIGVTTVKLMAINNNRLTVSGLDAMNGTPVLDIKPSDNTFFETNAQSAEITQQRLKSNPRSMLIRHIKSENMKQLLMDAAQMHGHYCPGLAMGVMAATRAVNELNNSSDGLEDVLAITETNSCFADGIQYVTGCSFGNNALIYRDLGKTAFTLASRNGKGIRISVKNDFRQVLENVNPDYQRLFEAVIVKQNHDEKLKQQFKEASRQRAFSTLELPFNDLFKIEHKTVEIPPLAPIHESVICQKCGESVISTRSVKIEGQTLCLDCAHEKTGTLSGHGIGC